MVSLSKSFECYCSGVPGVLRCKWRGVFTGVCSKLLSGLMSCRKVGLRESSSFLAKSFKWQACICSVLHVLERCARQENVREFLLKGHGRQSYVPLTCQA
ncbi:unnamed protein product [Sphagnum balticum]